MTKQTAWLTRSVILTAILCPDAAWAGDLDLLVGDRGTNSVLRFDVATGEPLGTFATLPVGLRPNGIALGSNGNLYVSADSLSANDAVLHYDSRGGLLGTFASGGGLDSPMDLTFGPDGNLYVASEASDNILRFDGRNGAFIDVFSSGGGLRSPAGIVFGADGDLYVGSYDNGRVLRYDGVSGQFVGAFAGGEELVQPVDVAFGPDGNLYVSAYGIWGKTDTGILRYDGMSGELIDVFATEGTRQPAGLLFVPDGGLFVAEHWNGNILRFDGGGTLQSVFAERTAPTFMVLIPEPATLCLMLAGLLLMGKGR